MSIPRVSRAGILNVSEVRDLERRLGDRRLTFNILDADPGPVAKIAGAMPLETAPDTYIITVDDDVAYGPRLVETLVAHASRHAAVGFECVEPRPFDHRHVSTGKWFLFPFDDAAVDCFGWLEGVHGVIYRRSFFDAAGLLAMQRLAPRGCWFDDDILIAGYLRSRGQARRIYPHYDRQMHAFASEPGLALIRHPQRDRWSRQCSNRLFGTRYDE